MTTAVDYREWCIVELMGHVRLGGLVTEVERFGLKMMRVEIHKEGEDKPLVQYIGASAIYRVTEATEEACRAMYPKREEPPQIGYDPDNSWEHDDYDDIDEYEDHD